MTARRRARLWRTAALFTFSAFVASVWPVGNQPPAPMSDERAFCEARPEYCDDLGVWWPCWVVDAPCTEHD